MRCGLRLLRPSSRTPSRNNVLRIIKRDPIWTCDANGHKLQVKFFREIRRNGATLAELSQEQWRQLFGNLKEPEKTVVDGVQVRINHLLEPDEVEFYNDGKLVATMRRLRVEPPRR